jgi:predicted RNA-binding protein with PIN domain
MVSDTPDAIEGALRAGRVAVVIDGYNLAMRAWPGEAPHEQRERLISLASNLRARLRTPVTVVFDGSDVGGVVAPRRAGVRVLFSAPGETADDVVVREVAATPPEIPVLAVTSDRDLCKRVGAEGALAVPVEAFADVLRG